MNAKALSYLDFELLNTPMLLREGSIVLHGAAEKGIFICEMLRAAGCNVISFVDSDSGKWGTTLCGIPVVSPQDMRMELLAGTGKKYVISCIENTNESYQMCSRLFAEDDASVGFLSYWGVDFCLHSRKNTFLSFNSGMSGLFEKQKTLDFVWNVQFVLGILAQMAKKSNEVFVFQPGKVGSSSVTRMLLEANIPCIQTHRFSYPEHILGEKMRPVWQDTVRRLRCGPNKIISLVRDPLSKDYSAFWQSFSSREGRYRNLPILGENLQEMYDGFLDAVLNGHSRENEYGISLPLSWREEFDWFDEEVKEYLDLDVYQYPFDREKGYTVIRKDHVELFLLKIEKLESALPALEAFLGDHVYLHLEKENAASGGAR